ncbi:hypothetical protein N7450_011733 [Penicillium hetheringtonii]|uniref:Uncharacterized protein n=1 Tax=Penicillium hetheringtonii TaxID=911720 RepID=A0AAD6DAH2_9EURO|nr:hypothetical protein N7450_011733 [Penicillium hetheringtonii]
MPPLELWWHLPQSRASFCGLNTAVFDSDTPSVAYYLCDQPAEVIQEARSTCQGKLDEPILLLMQDVPDQRTYEGTTVYLHGLRPDDCYGAATADGSNAIFVTSAHTESQLAGDGRLGKEKQLVSVASKF